MYKTITGLILVVCMITMSCFQGVFAQEEDYLLGIGDVVGIDVRNMGQKEYTLEALRIPATGRLSLPLLGAVNFIGQTTQQIEGVVRHQLSEGYLNQPEVTINVVQYRPFYVRGGVNTPGAFEYQFGLTVEKALAIAGGLSERGQLRGINIVRERDGQNTLGARLNTTVSPGDVVTVPVVSLAEKQQETGHEAVYLYGEVKNPGGYDFRDGMTVEKVIALAGGFGERASKRKLSIKRTENGKTTTHKKVPLTTPIMPGDIITVGQSYF